jgi:uncharacterized protein YjbJ (UPF0337 family)
MNDDVLMGQWKQIRGKVREWWGDLTDDDVDMINGKREQLIGRLQERYGYSRDRAMQEVDTRLREWEAAAASERRSY